MIKKMAKFAGSGWITCDINNSKDEYAIHYDAVYNERKNNARKNRVTL
jgi:hypothetical protein